MSANTVVKVNVVKLTKFGYADAEGYVSYSKNLTDHDKALVVPGAEFEAELYTAPSGARYLNKIVGRSPNVKVSESLTTAKTVETNKSEVKTDVKTEKKTFKPSYTKKEEISNGMSKEEWAAKDTRISRQGIVQAAVQALAPIYGDEKELWERVVSLSDRMLEYVNKK